MATDISARIQKLQYWCLPVLPAVFDDSLSYMELLAKVVKWLNDLVRKENELAEAVGENAEDIKQLQEDLADINQLYQDFLNGNVPQIYIEGITKWLDENLMCVVNRTVKFFSFGIDDTGHVYVDMPYTWYWLKISWDMGYGTEDFGKIQLEW